MISMRTVMVLSGASGRMSLVLVSPRAPSFSERPCDLSNLRSAVIKAASSRDIFRMLSSAQHGEESLGFVECTVHVRGRRVMRSAPEGAGATDLSCRSAPAPSAFCSAGIGAVGRALYSLAFLVAERAEGRKPPGEAQSERAQTRPPGAAPVPPRRRGSAGRLAS